MKKLLILAVLILLTGIFANAQTTNTSGTVIGQLQSYLLNNDTNYNGWQSNHFDLWEAAVFQNTAGVPGASAVGNVLGLEVPVYHFTSNSYSLHLESLTDFETLFGDVGWQGMGLGLDYNLHQVQISAGVDLNLSLQGALTTQAAPYIEFKKASTSLAGSSPFFRYEIPIKKNAAAGLFMVGVQFPF